MGTNVWPQKDMKHSPTDIGAPLLGLRQLLRKLPRRVYGHVQSQSNMIIPRRHKHTWAQLSYAIQGYLEVWTAHARFVALPHRAVWIPPGIEHRVRTTPHTIIRSLYLDAQAPPVHWPDCRILVIDPLLHELIRTFSTLPIEYDEAGAEGRLVQVMLDRLAQAPEAGLVLPWPADPRLHAICEHLHRRPDEALSLTDYSRRLGISEKTLTRLFVQQTGLGFRLWRQRARLVHALPLLERGDRITDVALACGYDSLSSFIAAFRESTGVTPRAFMAAAGLDTPARPSAPA